MASNETAGTGDCSLTSPVATSPGHVAIVGSGGDSLAWEFAVPYPVPQRRHRTASQSDRAHHTPLMHGHVTAFCRQKGHGFIVPLGCPASEGLFVHISDIDEEYVPVPGDEVEFRKIAIPPKNEKFQAVHVRIVHLAPNVTHHKWSERGNQ